MNKPLSDRAIHFFKENVDWNTSVRASLEARAKGFKWLAIAQGVVILALICAIVPLATLHEFIPIMIVQDKLTGDYEVRLGKEKINVEDKKNEQRMVADIARFVRAREGFTRGEAEQNFRIVFNSLPEDQRPEWRRIYVDDEHSNLKTLTVRDQIKVVNPSIQWLPSNDTLPNHRVAQFRFERERRLAGKRPTRQPFIATLTFAYDTKYVPSQIDDLMTNPFGFVVSNYRADPAGPEHELTEEEEKRAAR